MFVKVVASDFILAPYLADGTVCAVLKSFECVPLGIYALLPSNRSNPHRVSAFIECLAEVPLGGQKSSLHCA